MTSGRSNTAESTQPSVPCLICWETLSIRIARGRKSGKPSVMLVCPRDGRRFRAFVTDKTYVGQVLSLLEGQIRGNHLEDGGYSISAPSESSGADSNRRGGGVGP